MGHMDIGRLDTPFVAVERSRPVTSSNMEDAYVFYLGRFKSAKYFWIG
jgi:hypothetical protein